MHRDHSHRERTAIDDDSAILVAEHADESTAAAILRGIATMKGVPERDLETLSETIEPTAMEQLLEHSNRHDRDVTIEFTYEGYLVRVRSGGDVRIVADA